MVQEIGSPFRTRWLTVSSIEPEPVAADGFGVGEVEPEPVGLDLAPGLLGVLAQVGVQGMMQDVRGRVGPADRLATGVVDLGPDGGTRRLTVPSATRPTWSVKSFSLRVSDTSKRNPSPRIVPRSPTWPPLSP